MRQPAFSLKPKELDRLLSAIYALDLSAEAQLHALRDAWAETAIGSAASVCVSQQACPMNVCRIEHFVASNPALSEIGRTAARAASREMNLRMLYGASMAGFVTSQFGRSRAMRVSRSLGVAEFYGFLAPTHTGFAVLLGTPLAALVPKKLVHAPGLMLLAEHLAAAWRLRKRLSEPDAFEDNAECVLKPDGTLCDARGPAGAASVRARLRELVRARERALQRPSEKLWPALLDGRYTIVDRFERGGTRYVVAYRNARTATQLMRLSPLERKVVDATCAATMAKVVATDLGLSQSRVSTVLSAALRKLGLASAIDLTLLATSTQVASLSDQRLGKSIVAAFALPRASADALLGLTPAERAVTADLLRGLSNREIAAHRNRSERTIANQVASVLDKMGAPTRRALALKLRS